MKPTIHASNVKRLAGTIARRYTHHCAECDADTAFSLALQDVMAINDPLEAKRWNDALRPLVDQFLQDSIARFKELDIAVREDNGQAQVNME